MSNCCRNYSVSSVSFIFDAGYLLSFIIAFLPVLVGIVNLKEIRKDKS